MAIQDDLFNGYFAFETPQLIIGFLVLSLAFLIFHYRDGRAIGTSKLRDDLYQPPGIPFLGNGIYASRNRHRLLEIWTEFQDDMPASAKGKHLSVTLPAARITVCSKPEYIEYIQKTNFDNYVKGETFYKNTKQVLGDGIFATDGHKWFMQRKATSKIFNGNAFRGIIGTSLDHNLDILKRIIKMKADSGKEFDLMDLFFRFTLNSFSDMAFGSAINALSTETDAPVPFAVAFDEAQAVMDGRFTNPFWPVTELFNGTSSRMKKAVKVIDDFSYKLIEDRTRAGLNTVVSGEKKSKSETDLLSLYMAIRDEQGKPLSKKQLRDAVLNLIIAGRDTTAQATSWCFYYLLKNPEHITSIRKEIDEMGTIDYDSFKTMNVTNATFQEALRLMPSVPKNMWKALGDDQIPNGPSIKAGDFVFWSDHNIGRDESVWGPDAREFKPSRWIDETGALKKETQWKFHAFNGGARLCLGQELAKFEGAALIATILRDYDISFAPDYLQKVTLMPHEDVPRYAPSLTLPMLEPLRVIAKPRKKA